MELLFSTFKGIQSPYVLPSTLTLFSEENTDSKTLMMQAIREHFPGLEKKHQRSFKDGAEIPANYRNAFYQKMKDICRKYQIHDTILKPREIHEKISCSFFSIYSNFRL
ncbi:MAG: hypothetical protein AAFR87_25925 [Bacteroidota bacterium]